MLKQIKWVHFKPVFTQFSPFLHMYAPSCTLHMYLLAVLWSHVELQQTRGAWTQRGTARAYKVVVIAFRINIAQLMVTQCHNIKVGIISGV